MAGLIQQEMGAAERPTPPEQQMTPAAAQMGVQAVEGDMAEADSDPAFEQALSFAYEALYGREAAKDVAQQLKSAPDLPAGMADVAYQITSVVDERTNGDVPDEFLVPLAMSVLEEVSEIAEAAGLDPQPEDVATAFKTMILRYLQEQGVDTTQLQQAMDQVDPSEFRKVATETATAGG